MRSGRAGSSAGRSTLGGAHPFARRALALAALVLLGLGAGAAAAQSVPAPAAAGSPGRRVLLLFSEPRLTPAILTVDSVVRSTLDARSPVPITFYTEYLDLDLFDRAVPLPEMRELLRRKYATRPIDLIVAGGSPALRVALLNRAALFWNAPVVFVSVIRTAVADLRLDPDVTGTWVDIGWAETLAVARALQPGVRRVVVVAGASPADRQWARAARQQLTQVDVRYLDDRSLDEILTQARGLTPDTVVLLSTFLRDVTGRDYRTPEAAQRLSEAASVPVYGLTEASLGSGVVGGHMVSFEAHGAVAADLALRVLAGERPPQKEVDTNVPMFDGRQLARWGLDARRLPPGSRVLFGEPSPWARYRWYILAAGGVVLSQSALIGGLLVQRGRRRRAEANLAERLRFETLLSDLSARFATASASEAERSIRDGLRLVGEGLGVDWTTLRVLEGPAGEARLAEAWVRDGAAARPPLIREAQAPWVFARIRQGEVVRLTRARELPEEAGVDRRSLEALRIRSAVVLPLTSGPSVVGLLSAGTEGQEREWPDELVARLELIAQVFARALERHRAEGASRESATRIHELAGRLMTAQEEERRRIARDLHDDVNQELAALSIALTGLGGRLPAGAPTELRDDVARLQARTVGVAESIRHLSHALHPGLLEHIGLVPALRGYCGEFAREHGLPVVFRAEGDLGAVPSDVGLCLYRTAQEGLGNVAKHAAASSVRVTVSREGKNVVLTVADDGRGFDPAGARGQQGLGFLSLDERARLVQGHLTVDSRPMRGTTLRLAVPLVEGLDGTRDGPPG